MKIVIKNLRTYKGEGVYIGRKMGNLKGSVLANPFKIGVDGTRAEVLAKYRKWLWTEIKKDGAVFTELVRLERIARKDELVLLCWCAPEPCHGEIIKRYLEWVNEKEEM